MTAEKSTDAPARDAADAETAPSEMASAPLQAEETVAAEEGGMSVEQTVEPMAPAMDSETVGATSEETSESVPEPIPASPTAEYSGKAEETKPVQES